MNDRRFETKVRSLTATRTRRWVLKGTLGVASVVLAGSRFETEAARRGYSGPTVIAGGFIVTIFDGERPGELRIEIARGAIDSYLETRNYSSFLVDVDVRLPDGTTDNTQLRPNEAWFLRTGGSGAVHMSFRIAGDDHSISVWLDA